MNDYETYVLGNYSPAPINFVKGRGSRLWDNSGREYLDFVQGIATNTLGHCHPVWVKRVQEQANQVCHVSNLFRVDAQGTLARKISGHVGSKGRTFFCNSGAEANEALLKLARLHGRRLSGGNEGVRYKVICASNAFHGRTFGGMSATPQEKIQGGFRPMLDGFAFGEFNNVDSFDRLMDDSTAAVLVETIQGEAGVLPAEAKFLKGLRRLCDERGVLLMIDEVQCGTARTGKFFAFQHFGIQPDAIGMAKGLGGGFPIGAIWIADSHADLFQPGMHGTTFGGSPLACAAALAVLETIETEDLLNAVTNRSARFLAALNRLKERHSAIKEVRGLGFHLALAVEDNRAIVVRLRENGLLTAPGGHGAVRLLPPLTVSDAELDEAIGIIDQTFANLS